MTKIFTRSYNPFIMGGKCNGTIAITIPDPEWEQIGLGFEGALITDPNGRTHVIDRISGGIVGNTIEEVKRDIETCGDRDFMTKQSEEQRRICQETPLVSPERFWNMK